MRGERRRTMKFICAICVVFWMSLVNVVLRNLTVDTPFYWTGTACNIAIYPIAFLLGMLTTRKGD